MQTSVAVAGATGRSGIFTVRQLIQQKYHVAALVRNVEKAEKTFAAEVKQAQENGVSLRFVHCDVSKPESVVAAIVEQKYDPPVRGVISVLGATTFNPWGESSAEEVDSKGVKNVVDATKQADINNFALMSSVSITKWYSFITIIGLAKWKLLGENHLRNSGLNYVIVRPPRLTDDVNSKLPIWVRQGDTLPMPTTWMSREDAAYAMVHSMNYLLKPENAARQTKVTFESPASRRSPPIPTPAASMSKEFTITLDGDDCSISSSLMHEPRFQAFVVVIVWLLFVVCLGVVVGVSCSNCRLAHRSIRQTACR